MSAYVYTCTRPLAPGQKPHLLSSPHPLEACPGCGSPLKRVGVGSRKEKASAR